MEEAVEPFTAGVRANFNREVWKENMYGKKGVQGTGLVESTVDTVTFGRGTITTDKDGDTKRMDQGDEANLQLHREADQRQMEDELHIEELEEAYLSPVTERSVDYDDPRGATPAIQERLDGAARKAAAYERYHKARGDVGRVQRELALPPGWEAVCGVTRTLKRGEKYHLVYV